MATIAGGFWAPVALRLLRVAVSKTANAARAKVATALSPLTKSTATATTATRQIFTITSRQPIHPSALRRQIVHRRDFNPFKLFQNAWSRPSSTFSGSFAKTTRSSINSGHGFSKGSIDRAARFVGRTPFASTLRPNLTGGTLPRSAGGYGLGLGGRRFFSHGPVAPAEIISNVSQAMRAFMLSGKRAYREHNSSGDGRTRYRVVTAAEDEASKRMSMVHRLSPGSFIDFHLNPTITAVSSLIGGFPFASSAQKATTFGTVHEEEQQQGPTTLHQEGVMDFLSCDFARAVRDLQSIFADLKTLSYLGDLPITMEGPHLLRVRFPGVDVETVERLCDDIGIHRGMVGQDEAFDQEVGAGPALQFPFAPDSSSSEKTLTSPGGSLRSCTSLDIDEDSNYSQDENACFLEEALMSDPESLSISGSERQASVQSYEGFEGIYKFLEECDRAKGKIK